MKVKPNIAVIGLGGTIAAKSMPENLEYYHRPEITVDNLLRSIPLIAEVAEIKVIQYSQNISHHLTKDNLIQFAKFIQELSKTDIDGFVLTHGTHTMEETAYFLNLVLKTDKPIVLTGAMYPNGSLHNDGPKNLFDAICVASCPESKGKGVLITFNDRIFAARFVEKTNVIGADCINVREMGTIGCIQGLKVFYYFSPTTKHTLTSHFDINEIQVLPEVGIIYSYLEGHLTPLHSLIESGIQGIVSIGFGKGYQSKEIDEVLKQALSKIIPIVRVSRTFGHGLVSNDPLAEDSSLLIAGNNLSPQKAWILLMLALTKSTKIESIQKIFDEH
jgi:L-asparaginase